MADKFLNKVKYFMGLDTDEDENEEVEESAFNFETPELEIPIGFKSDSDKETTQSRNKYIEPKVNRMNKETTKETNKVNVTILQPADYNESAIAVNNLKAGKPVIVNLEALEIGEAKRILDFCSGAVYSLNGKIFKVSTNIFLLAPENVDISGNLKNSIESDYEME